MSPKESEAVPEGNGPVHQQGKFGSGPSKLEDVYRMGKKVFDRWDRKLDEMAKFGSACIKYQARCSATTSCHGSRRASRHQDSRAHGGRRYGSSSDAWG